MSAIKPAGWFNPYNDYHGYQQVAPEFEGKGDTIPLYQLPPGYVILSPDEVRGIRDEALEEAARTADERSACRERLYSDNGGSINAAKAVEAEETAAAIRSLKGGRE